MRTITEIAIANHLRHEVKAHGPVDVGIGAEHLLGVDRHILESALDILREKGFDVRDVSLPGATNPEDSVRTQILCRKEDSDPEAVYRLEKLGELEMSRIEAHTLMVERMKERRRVITKLGKRGMNISEIADIIGLPEKFVLEILRIKTIDG